MLQLKPKMGIAAGGIPLLMLIALCTVLWLKASSLCGEDHMVSLYQENRNSQPKMHRHSNITRCSKARLKNIITIRSKMRSNCPDRTPWWLSFAGQMSEGRGPLTHVNIGCNKGFDFLATLEDLSGDQKYAPQAFRTRLEAAGLMFPDKGACNQVQNVNSRPRPQLTSIRQVTGHCIEPAVETFQTLEVGMKNLQEEGTIFLSQDAFGSFQGQVFFPKSIKGTETGSIADEGIPVRATTLDDYAQTMGLGTVDLLSIDTEGNDMNVIYGGINFLTSHLVRVLEFEVHDINHWHVSRVDNVVALLDNLGFVCYWHLNGEYPLLRATGCMAEELETSGVKFWSNMVCANANEDDLVQLFDSISEQTEAVLADVM
jgi:FkbM family methyltransferase